LALPSPGVRSPRGELALLALVLAPIVVAWAPVIAGARSVCHQDLFYEHVPYRVFASECLARGEWPLWAPGIRGGYPLHANGEASLFSPLELPLRLLLEPRRACDLAFVLSSLLAGALAALFARELGTGRAAAALAGIAYGLSGRFVAAEWPNAAFVAALVPGLLLAVERARRDPKALGPAVALAVLAGSALLAGRPQACAVAAPVVLGWALLGLVRDVRAGAGKTSDALRERALPLLLGAGLGFGLGAPQTLPTLSLVADSDRGEGLSVERRAEGSLEVADAPLAFAAAGERTRRTEARAHAGVATLLLALAGVALAAARRGDRRHDVALAFFAIVSFLAFVLALGRGPLFLLVSSLPWLRGMRIPARFLSDFSLGIALAGALGLERATSGLAKARLVRALAVALVAIELVPSAWATIPWASPEVYRAVPEAVARLRDLPRDASGARPRFTSSDLGLWAPDFAKLDAAAARTAIERGDTLNGSRALAFDGLSSVLGYGEPVAAWQADFLAELTPGRTDALGIGAIVSTSAGALVVRRREPPLPRALVVPRAALAPSISDARDALDRGDPRAAVVLEDADAVARPGGSFAAVPARISLAGACRVEVEVEAPGEGWLVLFDAWDAGWRARVGERDESVLRAFGFFRAVHVPAGRSVVRFDYWPRELTFALALAALSLFAVVVGAVHSLRRGGPPCPPDQTTNGTNIQVLAR
jgi:hypothetical protein